MPENLTTLVSGSFVLCFGLSLGGKYVFSGNLLAVFLGIWLFSVGYRVCQIQDLKGQMPNLDKGLLVDELIMAAGVLISSYGFVLGASAVTSPEVFNTLIAGLCMVSGYMLSHRAVHEVAI